MPDQTKNPYLLLGVPYGTPPAEARATWAARIRQVRRDATFPYSAEDLNDALYEIEHELDDPDASVRWYRLPTGQVDLGSNSREGLFRPAPIPLPRATAPPTVDDVTAAARRAMRVAARAVLETAAPTPNLDPYQGDPA